MAHRIPEARAPEVTLRVLPRGLATVQDYRALMEAGVNRFHGWKWDASLGPEFVDPTDKQTKRHGGRVKQTDAVVEIAPGDPYRLEYVKHLRDGDLWAADEATARAAGVSFEPHFFGEHPETSKKLGVDVSAYREAALALADGLPWDLTFKPATPAAQPSKAPTAPPSSK